MRFVVISDTHGFHMALPELPPGDVLVCCGDWSAGHGHRKETQRFAKWMERQAHPLKLVVPGNHDTFAEESPLEAIEILWKAGVRLLVGTCQINGVVFGGNSWIPKLVPPDPSMPVSGVGYAYERTEFERFELWRAFPSVDVLITHTPPHGILDRSSQGDRLGCRALSEAVARIQPKLHLFGHVHEGRGLLEHDGTVFVNASTCTRRRFTRQNDVTEVTVGIRDPMVIDL